MKMQEEQKRKRWINSINVYCTIEEKKQLDNKYLPPRWLSNRKRSREQKRRPLVVFGSLEEDPPPAGADGGEVGGSSEPPIRATPG